MYGLKKEEVDERLLPFERFMNGEVMGQKKFIRNYSAGNKQKIGIISAMLHHPQLLILDEPFNFLDPSSQSVIKHLLKRYNEEHGATVIISSHNLNHTVDVCPRIALLENGVIIRDIRNENNSAEQELEAYFNVGVEEEAVVEETVVEAAVEEITEKEDKNGRRKKFGSMKKISFLYSSSTIILMRLKFLPFPRHAWTTKALAQASVRLGVDIELQDNHKLYIHASEWIGTLSRKWRQQTWNGLGPDWYRNCIRKRRTPVCREAQTGNRKRAVKSPRRNLREGDLVFFTSRASRKKWHT